MSHPPRPIKPFDGYYLVWFEVPFSASPYHHEIHRVEATYNLEEDVWLVWRRGCMDTTACGWGSCDVGAYQATPTMTPTPDAPAVFWSEEEAAQCITSIVMKCLEIVNAQIVELQQQQSYLRDKKSEMSCLVELVRRRREAGWVEWGGPQAQRVEEGGLGEKR